MGTIITPYGTFDALRVKTKLDIIDTVFVAQFGLGTIIPRPTQYEYSWFANGQGIPVMQVITSEAGGTETITGATFKDVLGGSAPSCVSSISEKDEQSGLLVFPNPANESIYIRGGNYKDDIRIYDWLGQEVYHANVWHRKLTSLF